MSVKVELVVRRSRLLEVEVNQARSLRETTDVYFVQHTRNPFILPLDLKVTAGFGSQCVMWNGEHAFDWSAQAPSFGMDTETWRWEPVGIAGVMCS